MSQNAGRSYFAIIAEAHVPALSAAGMVDLSPQYVVPKSTLIKALLVAPAVGVAGFLTVTFAGTYAAGEFLRLTITSNLTNAQQWRKSYTYTVVSGDTVTSIAAAFAALVSADISASAPYASAANVAGVLTITQLGDDKRGLVGYTNTDSASGTMVNVPTVTVYSEGQPSDLVDRGVAEGDINLASYDTVKIAANPEAPIPFINAVGAVSSEILWYGTVGNGAGLVTLINS